MTARPNVCAMVMCGFTPLTYSTMPEPSLARWYRLSGQRIKRWARRFTALHHKSDCGSWDEIYSAQNKSCCSCCGNGWEMRSHTELRSCGILMPADWFLARPTACQD